LFHAIPISFAKVILFFLNFNIKADDEKYIPKKQICRIIDKNQENKT